MSTPLWQEIFAKFMAETYNGGNWDDYDEEQKKVHRIRALNLIGLIAAVHLKEQADAKKSGQ